jgi:hypothetical protein
MVLWPIQSLLAWLEHIWKFFIWPVISQVRAGFNSFGAVGQCRKHASGPSPTVYNAFFLQARPKTLICSPEATK